MTKPTKASEFRSLSAEQIEQEVATAKRELFDLRVKQKTRQEFKASDFGYYKTKVAQLLTVAREQKLAEAGPSLKPRTLKAEEKRQKVAAGFPQF